MLMPANLTTHEKRAHPRTERPDRTLEPELECCGHTVSSHCRTCRSCHAPAARGDGACGCKAKGKR